MFPELQERLHSPGMTLAGRCAQDLGKPDGNDATSFYISRLVSHCSVRSILTGFNSSGSKCTIPAG
jgi:hypothetical protein